MVPPVASPPVKRRKGNYEYAINQAVPPTTAPPAQGKLLCFPETQTSMQSTVIPGQLVFPRLAQQNQPPEGSVQEQYQFRVPQGIQSPAGDPLKMPSGELSVQWQVLYYDTLIVLQYNMLTVQHVAVALYQR